MINKNAIGLILKIVPYVLALGIGIIWFLVYDYNAKKAIEKTKIDFPSLTYKQSLTGRVVEIYCPPEVRCSTPPILVIFDSGVKKSINAKASTDEAITLMEAISVGVSLIKKPNNDTLLIYKDNRLSRFLIY